MTNSALGTIVNLSGNISRSPHKGIDKDLRRNSKREGK